MSKSKGVVAAGHQVTVEAAVDILHHGGNAFDAVLAGVFASCVCEPVLASLGGGGCLMAYDAERNNTILYDFFVDTPRVMRAPQQTDFTEVIVDFGQATQAFHIGAGATAVPGIIPGMFGVYNDLCRLPMSRIVEPAARAARDGIVMTDFQAYLFTVVEPILTATVAAANLNSPGGRLLRSGDIYRNFELAETLEELAEAGPRLFVDGRVGQAIIAQSREQGGHLTNNDLSGYRVVRRDPLVSTYRGSELFFNPPPAAGGTLIAFSLAIIEAMTATNNTAKIAPAPLEIARAMAVTNRARTIQGEALETLMDYEQIVQHLATIDNHSPAPRGTTHISVIDNSGNAAAVTLTNGEGNGMLVGDTGFMLNNMLGEEDLNPHGFGTWQPGTRMSTMMAPTIMRDGNGTLTVLGSGGSNRIRSAIMQVVINLVDHQMTLEDAIVAPRQHMEKCGTLSFEDMFDEPSRKSLLQAFEDAHAWPERNMFFGGVHGVARLSDGSMSGAGDPRRGGLALEA